MLSLVFGFSRAAMPADELQNNINEKQQELQLLQGQIQDLQNEIAKRKKQAASLQNEIALYDLQIRQLEVQIQAVNAQIELSNRQILETEIEIKKKEEELEKQKALLAETLRLINEYDSISPLEMTLGNDTFSQFLDQVQYAVSLQDKDRELIETIRELKAALEQKKIELETELAKQTELKTELDQAQNSLAAQRAGKQAILAETRGQEKLYQGLLNQVAIKEEQISREIFELEVSVRRARGDKTLPPVEGLLRWPMSGILTQSYGNTGFTALGYSFHNGLDIAAPAGTRIYAAGDGVVYATGTGRAAYGNWVVIKHTLAKNGQVNNIYTLYAHIRNFVVSEGQAVRAGDLIGYEGNTGNTTRLLYGPERGYHLHFTVFDEDGFDIKTGAYESTYGPYQIPYGYTYNPMNFLK
ncbi:MAG: peptidoglycan DD-metalloendopeptidase family protein [Candidatus Doudnabacteria bacterium]|nr:peptidoglycan DD-metalloendopeptidase family protein [Candidatus Doudnabacteria bacterium]MBI4363430.1 peptidoglycan DD-metalloendopeptidase family protein [Candidatus Doudnabacteria bacterium]